MAKKTTYQKLKERIVTLENDIRELVLRPDSFESQMIKSDILFTEQMDKFARFEDSDRIIEAIGTTTLNECYVPVINLVCRMCESEVYKNDDGQFVCVKCGYVQ